MMKLSLKRVQEKKWPKYLVLIFNMFENESRTYSNVMSFLEASYWKEMVNSKIESIMNNHIRKLVDLPPESKLLDNKLIFNRKIKFDGAAEKYKAILVIKGFRQKKSVDYFDTYSPLSRITSIWTLIVIATINKLEIHQFDIKIIFFKWWP